MINAAQIAAKRNGAQMIIEMPRPLAAQIRGELGTMAFKTVKVSERLRSFDATDDVYFMPGGEVKPVAATPEPAAPKKRVAAKKKVASKVALATEQPVPEPGMGLNDGGERRVMSLDGSGK